MATASPQRRSAVLGQDMRTEDTNLDWTVCSFQTRLLLTYDVRGEPTISRVRAIAGIRAFELS